MDEVARKASNPDFAYAARARVWNKYIDPQKVAAGVFKDPAARISKKEPEVQEQDLGADFLG